MRNRFQFNSSHTQTLTTPAGQPSAFIYMPQDVLWLIAAMLPRKDRASFALTAKRLANVTREGTYRQTKASTERFLSSSAPSFTSLYEVEACLGTLIDYTYSSYLPSLAINTTHLDVQLQLARSIRLLLEYMCDITIYTPSLKLKLQRGSTIIESDETGMVVYTANYDDISRSDINPTQQTATKIQSAIVLNLTGDKLQSALNTNMAELSDTLRSISCGLTILNSPPAAKIINHILRLFTCGVYQSFTAQENRLIGLLLACTNAFAYRLNELNKDIHTPARIIEPQRINRR